MYNQVIPQTPLTPVSPADLAQQLVQALGMIAATQQQILNKLSMSSSQVSSGGIKDVPSFPQSNAGNAQYWWLRNHGLDHNLDGTRKTLSITAQDIEEHKKLVDKFWVSFCNF